MRLNMLAVIKEKALQALFERIAREKKDDKR
jgi:hypothetical protein